MEGLMILMVMVWLACTIFLMVLYHKCFTVIYFNAVTGILREIITSSVLAVILTYLIFKFWVISIIAIAVIVTIALIARSRAY
jgi:hypothetical protein